MKVLFIKRNERQWSVKQNPRPNQRLIKSKDGASGTSPKSTEKAKGEKLKWQLEK